MLDPALNALLEEVRLGADLAELYGARGELEKFLRNGEFLLAAKLVERIRLEDNRPIHPGHASSSVVLTNLEMLLILEARIRRLAHRQQGDSKGESSAFSRQSCSTH